MDVYLARQPIFDRDMIVQGYELLYRKSIDRLYEPIDEAQSSAELINSSFMVHNFQDLTGGMRGHIHFPLQLLQDDIPLLLPKQNVAIEIREPADPAGDLIRACKRLKDLGYLIVIDLTAWSQNSECQASPFDVADVIRVDYQNISLQEQSEQIRLYGAHVAFLASDVETRSDYQQAVRLGYRLFQGNFFSKPVMLKSRDIHTPSDHLFALIEELRQPESDPRILSGIIEKDLGLSYKLLKTANSAYFRPRFPLKSILQAVIHLGREEMLKWAHLMLLKQVQCPENAELIKCSLIRGKTLSLLAIEAGLSHRESDCFMTGILSSIDLILNEPMSRIVAGLPLLPDVQDALLGARNELRCLLDQVIHHEQGHWVQSEMRASGLFSEPDAITRSQYMKCTLEAIRWQQSLPM